MALYSGWGGDIVPPHPWPPDPVFPLRPLWLLPVSVFFLFLYPASVAAGMCVIDKGVSEILQEVTAKASAKFFEAASEAFLTFKAVEEGSDAFDTHRTKTILLLDAAIGDYKEAAKLRDDVQKADSFLKQRPFESLRNNFGITPGTLNDLRWQIIQRTARESKAPTADLFRVCVAGAESLKSGLSTVNIGMPPSLLRRSASAWFLALSHGALVSDAFDSSVR